MKVLVTGGAGYVGSVVVPNLLERGYEVRVLDNLLYGGNGLLYCHINPQFQLMIGDMAEKKILRKALNGVDAIIHLAAIVGYPACKKHPRLTQRVNVDAVDLLVKEKKPEQKLLFASTGSVYGVIEGECTEDIPLNPLSLYGITKKEGEEIVLSTENSVIYRFATAFGLSPRLRLDLLLNNFVFQAIKSRNLIIYEKNFMRTFIHVADMSRSFIYGLENFEKLKNEIYNVGNENMNFSKAQIVEKIAEKVKFYYHYADFDGDMDKRNYFVSYKKIKKKGFITKISIDRGIDELINGLSTLTQPASLMIPYSNTIITPYSENTLL